MLALVIAIPVGAVAGYRVELSPPGLKPKGVAYGAGRASLLVDSANSPLSSRVIDYGPLISRAQILSAVLGGADVRDDVARRLGLPKDDVAISGSSTSTNNVGGTQRSAQLVTEDASYQVVVLPVANTPIMSVSVTAPDAESAQRLISAFTRVAGRYVTRNVGTTQRARLTVRSLGPPVTGVVSPAADRALAAAVGLGTFLILAILFLTAARVRGDARARHGTEVPSG